MIDPVDSSSFPTDSHDKHLFPRNQVGIVVDKFWKLIPDEHAAQRINPMLMPVPHEHLLSLGREVIRFCESQGYVFENKLTKDTDVSAWIRLLGAWVCYCRDRISKEGALPSRACIAEEMGMGASSLTNFLNARRAVTLKALRAFSEKMGVKPLDIRPEMGASEVYSQERKAKKCMASIRSKLDDLLHDLEDLPDYPSKDELQGVMGKVYALRDAAAA